MSSKTHMLLISGILVVLLSAVMAASTNSINAYFTAGVSNQANGVLEQSYGQKPNSPSTVRNQAELGSISAEPLLPESVPVSRPSSLPSIPPPRCVYKLSGELSCVQDCKNQFWPDGRSFCDPCNGGNPLSERVCLQTDEQQIAL